MKGLYRCISETLLPYYLASAKSSRGSSMLTASEMGLSSCAVQGLSLVGSSSEVWINLPSNWIASVARPVEVGLQ